MAFSVVSEAEACGTLMIVGRGNPVTFIVLLR